jgi:hypothetical protein
LLKFDAENFLARQKVPEVPAEYRSPVKKHVPWNNGRQLKVRIGRYRSGYRTSASVGVDVSMRSQFFIATPFGFPLVPEV